MLRYDAPTDPRLQAAANDNGSHDAPSPELEEPVVSTARPGRLFSRSRSYAAPARVRRTPPKPPRKP